MVQKRPFEVGEAQDISSKLLRQDPCDKLLLFSDISSFGDARHVSGISDGRRSLRGWLAVLFEPNSISVCVVARGGFTEGKLVYDEDLPSIEKDIKHSPGREDDQGGSLHGRHSFSSGGTSSTSEEDVWIEPPFNTCFFPEYFYPERPVTTLTRREDIYSLLLGCPPQKLVPIGPLHQANIPPLRGDGDDLNPVDSPAAIEVEDEVKEPLSGTSILPMPAATSSSEVVVKPGHGRTDCSCLDKGSIRCGGLHVVEARDKLKILLGVQVFEELGFSDMGEQVAEKWTEEEENLFHEVVFSNPSSMGRNFWNCLSHAFPSRTKAEIVSYYFNVFMLRKRAEQNRFDPVNVDSDNDEWQAIEEEDEYSVVESPFYQLHPVDGSGYNSDECQNENITDEACDDDGDSGPHIARVDDSQANSDFQPVQNTWYETGRSYHGTQDDSCTSFDIGTTMPATRVKFDGGVCNGDVVGTARVALLRSEVDLMPTFSRIEEVFRDKLSNCEDLREKGPG